VRLSDVSDILVWFSDGSMLLSTPNGVAIGKSLPDRLEIHAVASGALGSPLVARENGERYAVIGKTLVAFDAAGRARALGSVRCDSVAGIFPSSSRVAVYCDKQDSLLIFAEPPAM
jgi:hypothetical protein